MKLNDFAARVEQGPHLADFPGQIVYVSVALAVVEGDHGSAAAEPAERLAEGDVEIERKVALGLVVFEDTIGKVGPGQGIGELGGRRIGRVSRAGHVVL